MSNTYSFHQNFVIRTPRFPINTGMSYHHIDSLLHNNGFLESIYLASPVLYNECLKYKNGTLTVPKEIQKLKKSLVKYYLRSVTRCTPFGLFSGCSVGSWANEGKGIVLNSKVERHTRFDMLYLCALGQHLSALPGIKENLIYFTNNSQYTIGDEIRYVEYKYISGTRIHQISSVNATDYLEQLLKEATSGITIGELEKMLAAPDITDDDISQFLDELLAAQLLVSEMEPAITGDEFIHQLLGILKRIFNDTANDGVLEIIEILEIANNKLQKLDSAASNTAEAYQEIMQLLNRLGVPYDESKLFQTDMVRQPISGGLPAAMQTQLLEAIKILNRFGNYHTTSPNMQSFGKRFYDRYEDREMPLLEVLDTETGIGYLESGAQEHAPLVEDIAFSHSPNPTQNYPWGPIEKYLMRKVTDSYHTGNIIMELEEEEMVFLDNQRFDDLPPSMHIMFRVVDEANNLVHIENAGSASASSILARFGHADEKIHQLVSDIVAKEEALNPDVIFAEIIHLPESRVGNVLLHPSFRKYEIPYLAKSSVDKAFQINIQDLMISVLKGQIRLRCKRTGKYIVPRLSSAHNFQQNALPVYQFLCDLQLQQQRGSLSFNWGSIAYLVKSLPRIQYKNTILSLATWRLLYVDYKGIIEAKDEAQRKREITAMLEKWRMPRLVVLANGDNELFIDFENEMTVDLFVESVKKKSGIELKEFIFPRQKTFQDENGQPYNNQIVAAIIKEKPTYQISTPQKTNTHQQNNHSFIIGSQWLYYKIYCGAKSADKILVEALKPVTEAMKESKLIEEFFFIRYNDPMFHIRFRIKLTDTFKIGEAVALVHRYIQPFHQSGHIWKLQTDTYNRETERYGANTIELAEQIFHYDSLAVLHMLGNTWGDAREHVRWLWTMRAIGDLLDAFNLDLDDKLNLTTVLKESFAKEFKADKFLKEQLNAKFRKYRNSIENIMDSQNDQSNKLLPLLEILSAKQRMLQPIANQLLSLYQQKNAEVPLAELLISYIHMLVNRVTASKTRLHELVIYDFLQCYYKAVAAQQKQRSKEAAEAHDYKIEYQS